MARQIMIRHRRPRDPRRMDGVDRDDFLTAAWPTTEPSSPSLGQEHPVFWTVRLRLPLAVCGASPRSHLWIWRLRSPCHIQGKWQCLWWQLLLCLSVFVGTYSYWAQVVLLHSPRPLHTTRFAEYRICAPIPSWTQTVHILVNLIDPFLHRQIFTVPPPWAATIYNIVLQSLAHVLDAVYTLIWLQTPLPFCRTPLFLNPHSCGLW